MLAPQGTGGRTRSRATDGRLGSQLLPQGRRLSVGVPGAHSGPGIYPQDRRRRLRRRLHDQLEVECVPGDSGTHMRSSVRAGLPQGTARGAAGRDLPAEARRRRSQAGHRRAAARRADSAKRQARRLRRRRSRVADGRARSRRDRLRGRRVRFRHARRRHDAQPDSKVSAARRGDRRRGRLRFVDRRPIRRRATHRQPQGADGRRLRRDLRRLRRAARAQPRHSRAQGSCEPHPYRHRLAGQRFVRPYLVDRPTRGRAGRRQHGDGLLPDVAPSRRRRGQGRRALRLRRDEGLAMGKGRRDARGRRDPELPRAQGVHP